MTATGLDLWTQRNNLKASSDALLTRLPKAILPPTLP